MGICIAWWNIFNTTYLNAVQSKPPVFEIGFQFHTPGKKENILSKKKKQKKNQLVKTHVTRQKSQTYGIFKNSMLEFKDALIRLSNHF